MTFMLVFAAIAACGIFLLFFGIGQARRAAGGAEDFQARLAQYGVDPSGGTAALPPQTMRERLNRLFQPAADRLGQGDAKKGKPSLAEQLAKADLKLRTSEFFMIQIGCVALPINRLNLLQHIRIDRKRELVLKPDHNES